MSLRAQVSDLQKAVEVEKQARPESVSRLSVRRLSCQLDGTPQNKRAEALAKLATLKAEYENVETELAAYGACDPVKMEEKRRAIVLAKEAAVRWTGK